MSDITIHGFKEPEGKFPEKPSYTKIVLTAKKASSATLKSLNQQERALLKLALNSLSSTEGDTIACQAVIEKLKANKGKIESTTLLEKVIKGASNLFANRISSTALQESLSLISETKAIELQADLLVSQTDFEGAIALLRQEIQKSDSYPTLLEKLADVYVAYKDDPKASSHLKSANKIYKQLNIPKKIEISNKGFGTEHRMKLASTEETKKLQVQIQGKNYYIQLDANPYVPTRSNKPDNTKAQLWIDAHPDIKSQKVAALIVDNTTHIPFDTFKTALSKSVQNFNDSLQEGEKYIIAVYEEREPGSKKTIEKSNKWVVEHALSSLKQLPEQVVSAKNAKMYMKEHPEIKRYSLWMTPPIQAHK